MFAVHSVFEYSEETLFVWASHAVLTVPINSTNMILRKWFMLDDWLILSVGAYLQVFYIFTKYLQIYSVIANVVNPWILIIWRTFCFCMRSMDELFMEVWWQKYGWSIPMNIGSSAFAATIPPGWETQRSSWIAGGRCLRVLLCWKSVVIYGRTQQSSCGSPFRPRGGRQQTLHGGRPLNPEAVVPLMPWCSETL